MRIFFDTNVLASAFTARGLCAELYEQTTLNHQLVIGEPVIEELLRVLAEKLRVPAEKLAMLRKELDEYARAPTSKSPLISSLRDKADAVVIACAIKAKVDVFVTGDKELLALGEVSGMPIVSPRRLWQRLMDSMGEV